MAFPRAVLELCRGGQHPVYHGGGLTCTWRGGPAKGSLGSAWRGGPEGLENTATSASSQETERGSSGGCPGKGVLPCDEAAQPGTCPLPRHREEVLEETLAVYAQGGFMSPLVVLLPQRHAFQPLARKLYFHSSPVERADLVVKHSGRR